MHWVVSEARSDNASDRVSGGIGDADGASRGAVAAGRLLLGGLDGLSDGQAGVGGPLPGGSALHWDNIPVFGGQMWKLETYGTVRY